MTAVALPTSPFSHPEHAITVSTPGQVQVRLVEPGPLPEGAVVLGLVVAVPAAVRQLVALPSPADVPNRPGTARVEDDDGVLECRPGLVVDRRGRRVHVDGEEIVLRRREYGLLEYLVTHPGHVFTRRELLSAVWDTDDVRYSPVRTVDVHVSRLRRRLGAHGQALQSVRGVGYRWSGSTRPRPGIR